MATLFHRSPVSPSCRRRPRHQHVTAHVFGCRTNATLNRLTALIKRLNHKTICFSYSEELHDKVIGEFISRMWDQPV
ncbi:IS1 family transposase [Kistimonas asteriae]|uniref:IS1 family transposase n=1 Tax=Kistimonas asteriae TaxID=517724 RepID=UPI0031B88EFF